MPHVAGMVTALLFVGAASVTFVSVTNTTLQLDCAPAMRGRVMSLLAVGLIGTGPIGGPIAGAVSEHLGGRWAMVMQASACLVAAAIGLAVSVRLRGQRGGGPVGVAEGSPRSSVSP